MTTLLIDADTIAFKACLAHNYDHEWDEGVVSRGCNVDDAYRDFVGMVHDLGALYATDKYKIALTGPTNFRKTVLPTYKSKRGPKPIGLGELKGRIINGPMKGVVKANLEADDIVGIWATHPTLIKGDKLVVSIDKDLRTIPGAYSKGDGETVEISKGAANYAFLMQVLTGDTTDGYTGLPGCGPKKAEHILAPHLSSDGKFDARRGWKAVLHAYEAKGLTADDALVQARVARILRYQDFNFKTKEPILWTPPRSS